MLRYVCALAVLAAASVTAACGGDRQPTTGPARATPAPEPDPEAGTGLVAPFSKARPWFRCGDGAKAVSDRPKDPVDVRRPREPVRGHAEADLIGGSVTATPSALCVQWVVRGPLGAGSVLSVLLRAAGRELVEVNVQLGSPSSARVSSTGFGDEEVAVAIGGEVGVSGRRASLRVQRTALPAAGPSLRRFRWALAAQNAGILDQAPDGGFPSLRFP